MSNSWVEPTAIRQGWLLDEGLLPDDSKIEVWIDRAQVILQDAVAAADPLAAPLAQRVDADPAFKKRVGAVIVAMVERVLKNPSGARSITEVTGPMTDTVTYGGETPGALVVMAAELRSLGVRVKRRRQRAFSVPTSRG